MNQIEVDKCLESFVLIVDTREQETERMKQRLSGFNYIREKLDFGDYSAKFTLPDGNILSLKDKVCIERKMNLDELVLCLTSERKRFIAEFERAKASGAKIYLLVENGTWEKVYNGMFRSKAVPKSIISSLTSLMARYGVNIIMCSDCTTKKILRDILYREGKVFLEKL